MSKSDKVSERMNKSDHVSEKMSEWVSDREDEWEDESIKGSKIEESESERMCERQGE